MPGAPTTAVLNGGEIRSVMSGSVRARSLLAVALASAPMAVAAEQKPATPTDYSAPPGAPYTAENVTVPTPAGHTLAGTLTLPTGASAAKPIAAVITITGSGPQDRDEYLGIEGYRPFRQYADALGRRGIAVLRMDDRGVGASSGTFKGTTSAQFAEDIRAGLAYLRSRREIDAQRLGIVGHSEGAVIAPMVADVEPTVRAIVLLAGVARPMRNTLAMQMKNLINHDAKLTPPERDAALAAIPARIDAMMAEDPWMKFFLTHDPAATARRVKTPVLILTGANDQQAPPEEVAEQEAAFRAAGNTDVTAHIVPGVNHLFVADADGFPGSYAKLPPPVQVKAEVIEEAVDWLVRRLR
jgi:dipeptidyl aminopeptidase/acylaminoacyl peptidase